MYAANNSSTDYNAILATIQLYIDGSRAGKSDLMRPAFHPDSTIVGFFSGDLVSGPIDKLYHLIDGNGPAPDIEARFASVEILNSIAVVRVEVERWSGNVIGSNPRHMSDLFNLIKTESGWKISHKMFHLN